MPAALKHPAVVFGLGIIAGYMLTRVLDTVPVIKNLPKIRVS